MDREITTHTIFAFELFDIHIDDLCPWLIKSSRELMNEDCRDSRYGNF